LTGFVHAAIRGFLTNGITVPGVMVRDLRLTLPREKTVSDIIQNVNTAKESSCVSCGIAPGVTGKSDSPGSSDLFPKYAVGAGGL